MNETCNDCIHIKNLLEKVNAVVVKVEKLEIEVDNVKDQSTRNEERTKMVFNLLTKIEASIDKIATKLDVLEGKPGQRWEQAIRTILTVAITAFATWFFSNK